MMLTTHRLVKNKNDIIWMEKFELVKEFKKEFGRFPKQNEKYKGTSLGRWCILQRQAYKGQTSSLLTQDRVDLLNSINFIWDVYEYKWMSNFELVKEFKKEFGRFPVFNEMYKGINLGVWCYNQRHIYRGQHSTAKLSQRKIDLLDSINFSWDPNEDSWINFFNILKEFKKEFNRFPHQKEMYKGIAIGVWAYNQRQTYRGNRNGNLTQEKIKLLESIGFEWNIKNDELKYTLNEKWMKNFELLKEFKEEFNRFPKNRENYKGVNLGRWCNTQRNLYTNKELEFERMHLLNSINFIWNPLENEWMKNFELVKEFKEEFNRFPYQKEVYKEVGIGKWCNTQRLVHNTNRSGSLTQEKIELLESIGFKWRLR